MFGNPNLSNFVQQTEVEMTSKITGPDQGQLMVGVIVVSLGDNNGIFLEMRPIIKTFWSCPNQLTLSTFHLTHSINTNQKTEGKYTQESLQLTVSLVLPFNFGAQ